VKQTFQLNGVRYVGDLKGFIQKVGIIGGSGGTIESILESISKGCDCLITSEVKLHIAQFAESLKFALIEVNHGVERFALIPLASDLERKFNLKNRIFVSQINTDPLKML
jgi:putative NIF3 family GTP cyclohydrolase 1 type 2